MLEMLNTIMQFTRLVYHITHNILFGWELRSFTVLQNTGALMAECCLVCYCSPQDCGGISVLSPDSQTSGQTSQFVFHLA